MQIAILTLGSRGDIQPYLALGVCLQRAGHTVTLTAPVIFERWIRSYGLAFVPLQFNPYELTKRPEVRQIMRRWNVLRMLQEMGRLMESLFAEMVAAFWQASQGVDAIVVSPVAYGGYGCAEKMGVPVFVALVQPLINPTRAFPTFALPPGPRLGPLQGAYNKLTHLLFEQALWQVTRKPLNRWRQDFLGLPPLSPLSTPYDQMRAARVPWLFAYSPAVLPKPRDWADWHYVTGYWFLDAPSNWQPPAALVEFLEAGSRPVYIGFGSMSDANPEALTRVAIDALQMAGQRGVLLSGWDKVRLPDTVFRVESVPHDWLFPQMAAIVHHGGAGTTGAGLRSGVPSILTPFVLDQFAWASVVARLGVGPKPIPARRLTAERLAAAIHIAVTDKDVRTRAAALGGEIRTENGVSRAVAIIQNHCAALG